MEPPIPNSLDSLSHDHEWVINISRSLENIEEEDNNEELNSVSIFNVPKSLYSSKPESYTPQVIALGPYHHRRLELFEMERHKLAAAKKIRNKWKTIKFCDFVTRVTANDFHIRSCYHRYLDFDQQMLAWMLAIDVSFLFLYLRTYHADGRRNRSVSLSRRNSLKIGHFVDCTRRNTWHQAVLRDIIMLENQIPLFLLGELHGFCHGHEEANKDEMLAYMLIGFCKDLAPIKHIDEQRFKQECFTRAHLLELLYYAVAPCLLPYAGDHDRGCEKKKQKEKENAEIGIIKAAISSIWYFICVVNRTLIRFVFEIFKSKIIMQLITVIASIFKFRGAKSRAINDIVSSAHDVIEEAESAVAQQHDDHQKDESPLVEEIAIPRAEELSKIGVQFRATKGGLSTIKFEKSSVTFHLPVIHLNDNSDVVLRNLVAYEACIAPEEGMVFTRYTELMNGIIDTEEDVRILREAGILVNRLKSDKEVASLWNGMTASVKVTKVPILDKAIEGANAYYWGSWKVKVTKGMKKYVYASWPCLTFLAANAIIFFSAVEALCSIYHCSKWLGAL